MVQQSFPPPRPTTNPYLVQLAESLRRTDGLEVRTFSWKSAIRADYDVFHVHWPENLPHGHSALKSFARRMLTRLLLLRLRWKKIPVVRTMHNLDRPTGRSRAEHRVLDKIDRQTALVIRLNDLTEVPPGMPNETIPHGHYIDWFGPYERSGPVPARLAFFGLIRRYKNVPHLVRVHRSLPEEFTLRVAGNPSSDDLAAEIVATRDGDERVLLDFHFLKDAELVTVVTESELVVLPYTDMHNSGSVLSSLSLGRPVLVQDNAVNRALSAEVGDGWVHLYSGELTGADILRAHAALVPLRSRVPPDLHLRNWDATGGRHLVAYLRARAILTD